MADDSGDRRDVERGLPSQPGSDLGARPDNLTVRVEALAGLVESFFDRLELSRATPSDAPITAEEVADIGARMVRLVEVRLESHSERLEQMIGARAPRQLNLDSLDLGVAGEGDSSEVGSELPGRVSTSQPIARLDAAILQQLDARLTETGEALAQKVEDQLAARVQRFEALSQAMMTMVGDPVDALAGKLAQVVRAQEAAPNVLLSIAELTQIQGQLAAAITSLRQDGLEREALLRHALEKLDRLTGDSPKQDLPPD